MTRMPPENTRPLPELLTNVLPALLRDQKKLETHQQTAEAVDGAIIGTGEADFTQDNIAYRFKYQGKTFQLLDMPGIEGEETKYEKMVHDAIAKAHLVFYVNSTEKKPEAETVRKIRRYLSRDGVVCAICNIRGYADRYEFDGDRKDLDQTHDDSPKIREETRETLEEILGSDLLEDCVSVQGLLAFSGLAYSAAGLSTISSRDRRDLFDTQSKYCKEFESAVEMRRFSRIDLIASLIRNRARTFEDDIVDSNKRKILKLIDDTIAEIEDELSGYKKITEEISEKVSDYKEEIRTTGHKFSQNLEKKILSKVERHWNEIQDSVIKDLENRDLDRKNIEKKLENMQKIASKNLDAELEKIKEDEKGRLDSRIDAAQRRLDFDIRQARLKCKLSLAAETGVPLTEALDALDVSFDDFASVLTDTFTYGLTGFRFVKNVYGAILGSVIGMAAGIYKWVKTGKDVKVEYAKKKATQIIERQREKSISQINDQFVQFNETTQYTLENKVIMPVDEQLRLMEDAEKVLENNLDALKQHRDNVGGKNYGKP